MELKQPGKQDTYFENLDGLRFFCFFSVFFYHSFITDNPAVQSSAVYKFVKQDLFGNGNLGVNFFFVLSGFLITYLLIKEKRKNGQVGIGKFWVRRILRIWPLYFVCVFYGFVIFPYTKQIAGLVSQETADPLYYLTFVNNFDYIKHGLPDSPGLGVLWSVAIEEQFYFVWPIVLFLLAIKRFWIAFSAIIAGSILFRLLYDVPLLHEMHTLSCIGDMAIGAFGAWFILERPAFQLFIHNLSRTAIAAIYLAFLVFFFFRDELFLQSYLLRVFERPFFSIIILLIILEQCYAANSFYKMGKFKIPTKLGIYTYGLYCLHFIVISGVTSITKKLGLNKQFWQVLVLEPVISLAITITAAYLSYHFFEKPFLKLKDRFAYTSR